MIWSDFWNVVADCSQHSHFKHFHNRFPQRFQGQEIGESWNHSLCASDTWHDNAVSEIHFSMACHKLSLLEAIRIVFFDSRRFSGCAFELAICDRCNSLADFLLGLLLHRRLGGDTNKSVFRHQELISVVTSRSCGPIRSLKTRVG